MNKQDERFWSEFPEDEAKDPTNQRILAALREIYHIDADDQQSVRRAWQRISALRMNPEQQHIARLDTLHDLSTSFSLMRAEKPAHMQKSSVRRRIDTLVALGIVFLLVGSMLGVIGFRNMQQSQVGGQGSRISTQRPNTPVTPKRLGTHLGVFSLGQSFEDVITSGVCPHGEYSSQKLLNYYCGVGDLVVSFNVDSKPLNNNSNTLASNEIVQLTTRGKFSGKTAEGLGLGMSRNEFDVLYQQFTQKAVYSGTSIQSLPFPFTTYVPADAIDTIISVKDTYGTTLWVVFSPQQKQILQIVLQSSALRMAIPAVSIPN